VTNSGVGSSRIGRVREGSRRARPRPRQSRQPARTPRSPRRTRSVAAGSRGGRARILVMSTNTRSSCRTFSHVLPQAGVGIAMRTRRSTRALSGRHADLGLLPPRQRNERRTTTTRVSSWWAAPVARTPAGHERPDRRPPMNRKHILGGIIAAAVLAGGGIGIDAALSGNGGQSGPPGKCPMWSVWCSRFPRRTSVRRSVTRFSWVAAGLDVRAGDWNPIAETVSARSRAHPSLRRILSRESRSLFIHSRRGALPRRRAARGWLVDIDSDLVPAPRRTRDAANLAAPTRAVSF
jgi:hypothetical protein